MIGATIMHEVIVLHEPVLRTVAFLGTFAAMALWEIVAPCRPLVIPKARRWVNNIALVILNTAIIRLLLPMSAVGVAEWARVHGAGLLNLVDMPAPAAVVVTVVALDFVIWLQHVMVHAIPALWRLHRVHHADLDYDLTTGTRFHPLEIVISMLIKMAAIILLGPPVTAVVLFELLLNATSMFNHGNVRLPPVAERVVRWWLVTPDMHRVHHSIADDETNSNFGFNLPWWDRLFGTYRAQPRAGHAAMTIGIDGFRDPRDTVPLPAILGLPFRPLGRGYAINRRAWKSAQGAR